MPISMLKKLPKKAAKIWEAAYQAAKPKYGEKRAARIAWAAVKKRFKKVQGKWVAKTEKSSERVGVYYKLDTESLVTKTEDGELMVDAILSGSDPDATNDVFHPVALKEFAEQINNMENGLPGRIDVNSHSDIKSLYKQGKTPEEIINELNTDPVIRAVKAWVKDGKLYIRSVIRKGYEQLINQFNGLSLDAFVPGDKIIKKEKGSAYMGGRIAGFVLTNNPAYKSSGFIAG